MIELLASNNLLITVIMTGVAVILVFPLTILAIIIIFARARTHTKKN